jgi:hypothetical protein
LLGQHWNTIVARVQLIEIAVDVMAFSRGLYGEQSISKAGVSATCRQVTWRDMAGAKVQRLVPFNSRRH